jgi:2-dehydro-3-deoxygluconokinase
MLFWPRSAPTHPGSSWLDEVSGQFRVRCDLRLLTGKNLATAVEHAAAHGALAMTTPGDTSMALLREVENPMKGARALV